MYGFRVAHNTISCIVREVCSTIIKEYQEEVIACPTTSQEWSAIADLFTHHSMSQKSWLTVLQLQGIPFHLVAGSGR